MVSLKSKGGVPGECGVKLRRVSSTAKGERKVIL